MTQAHNPNYIDENRPARSRPRKMHAGRFHKLQQAALVQEPIETDIDTEIRRSIKQRAIAEALMLLMFRMVWALNLAGTVAAAVLLGRKINVLLLGADLAPLAAVDYALIAAAYQLFITHVQQYLWRTGETYSGTASERARAFWRDLDKTKLSMVVFFGVTDALPTAFFVMVFSVLLWDTIPWALPYILAAGIAVPMAMLVEPVMTKHRRAMKRLFASLGYETRWM